MRQGVLEALVANLATQADLLGLAGGAALLREEGLGVRLRAQRAVLPLIRGRRRQGLGLESDWGIRNHSQVRTDGCRRRRVDRGVRCACHNAPKVLIRHASSASSALI